MDEQALIFFSTVINAGAILSGFCGTFLSFRIQREAAYYRQVALSYDEEAAKDIEVGLSHFTTPLLLLLMATLLAIAFGFIIPLFALAGLTWATTKVAMTAAGLAAAVAFLLGYFANELHHYGVFSAGLHSDRSEWVREAPIVAVTFLLALLAFILTYRAL